MDDGELAANTVVMDDGESAASKVAFGTLMLKLKGAAGTEASIAIADELVGLVQSHGLQVHRVCTRTCVRPSMYNKCL